MKSVLSQKSSRFAHRLTCSRLSISQKNIATASLNVNQKKKPYNYWTEESNQREFVNGLATKLNVNKVEDWYKLTKAEFVEYGGGPLLNQYSSYHKFMETMIPELKKFPWRSHNRLSPEFWKTKENQKAFMADLSNELNIKTMEDWYSITKEKVEKMNGVGLLKLYNGQASAIVMATFPEYTWKVWKFEQIPTGYWTSARNQQEFFDDLAKKLNIQQFSDWYNIKLSDILQHGGSGLLKHYNGSFMKALLAIYPQHEWQTWKFSKVEGIWNDVKNQKAYFEWLGKKLNIQHWRDWYKVKQSDVLENGGAGLLQLFYENSYIKAITTLFPEHPWQLWNFEKTSHRYWMDLKNQREFLDYVYQRKCMTSWEDWYHIRQSDFIENGGRGLIHQYGGSHIKALCAAYPEHPWQIWRFDMVKKGYWTDDSNVVEAVSGIAEKLNIQKMEDWYNVTTTQMQSFGAQTIMEKFGGLMGLLQKVYPHYNWKTGQSPAYKAQTIMFSYLKELFPNVTEVHVEYQHPQLKYQGTDKYMQLDVFIPVLQIAFEYQGAQHYLPTLEANGNGRRFASETYQERDEEKRKACKELGITLIEVPFWWDQTKESLAATIHEMRPDLIERQKSQPIPLRTQSSGDNPTDQNTGNPGGNDASGGDGDGSNNSDGKAPPPKFELANRYVLSRGNRGGSFPKCRGCGRQFNKREELRVIVFTQYTLNNSTHTTKVNLCIKSECVEKAIKKDTRKKEGGYNYPEFKGVVSVPADLLEASKSLKLDGFGVKLVPLEANVVTPQQ